MDAKSARIDQPQSELKSQPGPHFLPQLPRVGLEIVRGQAKRRVRDVKPPVFLIGSAEDCDLVLGDSTFPEAYAYLYVTVRGISIRYLGTGPELAVNGETTETTPLVDGDLLELGSYEFQVQIEQRGPGRAPHRDPETDDLDEARGEFDFLGLDAAVDEVWELLAEIRRVVAVQPVDLRLFVGPPPSSSLPKRPLAAFMTRRISA